MPDANALLEQVDAALAGPEPYDEILRHTHAALGTQRGTIHLLGDDGFLHLRGGGAGLPPPVLEQIQRIPVGRGMAGQAVERAEPVTTCNLQEDTTGDVRPGARQTGLQGSICVPVLHGERAVGAFGVANFEEREFSVEEFTAPHAPAA